MDNTSKDSTSAPVHVTASQILRATPRTQRGDSGGQFPTEWSKGDGSTLGSKTGQATPTRKAMEAFVAEGALEVDSKRDGTAAVREGFQGEAGASALKKKEVPLAKGNASNDFREGLTAKLSSLTNPGSENHIG